MRKWSFRISIFISCFAFGALLAMLWLSLSHKVERLKAMEAVEVEYAFPELKKAESSAIRKVDFNNFTYPPEPIYSSGAFTLRDGKYEGRPGMPGEPSPWGDPYPVYLVGVVYGDVTDDGEEDAIVILNESTPGTAIIFYVYVYSMRGNRPHLLRAFETGDRADGGLRKIYSENGELVIELYGKNTRVDGQMYGTEDAGACCPLSFTRTRYQWLNGHFRRRGLSQVFSTSDKSASLAMFN